MGLPPPCHPDRAQRAEGSGNGLPCPRDFSTRSLCSLGRNDRENPCLHRLAKPNGGGGTGSQLPVTEGGQFVLGAAGEVAFCPLGKMTEGAVLPSVGSDASARSAGCSELSCDRNNEQEERLATLCDYVSGWMEDVAVRRQVRESVAFSLNRLRCAQPPSPAGGRTGNPPLLPPLHKGGFLTPDRSSM